MPRPEPSLHLLPSEDGVSIACWEWPGNGQEDLTVVLVHAAGFHSRTWDSIIRRLPEGLRCVCLDVPGHGRSSCAPEVSWRDSAERLRQALQQFSVRPESAVLVGHSVGGYICALLAAAAAVRGLLLVEPVIMPRRMYSDSPERLKKMESVRKSTLGRKARFADAEEMLERFRGKHPYNQFQQEILWDFCRFALGATVEDGQKRLLCKPAVEAEFYVDGSAAASDPTHEIELLKQRRQRAVLLRGAPDPKGRPFVGSATDPALAQRLGAEDVPVDVMTHFLPMTHPELVASHIVRLAGASSRL